MAKVVDILKKIFGIVVFCTLMLGGLAAIGFVVAMFLGPEIGGGVAVFIKTQYFPLIIRMTSIIVLVGFMLLYLTDKKK